MPLSSRNAPNRIAGMTRRQSLGTLAGAALTGCSSDPDVDYAAVMELFGQVSQSSSILRKDAAGVPYASLGVREDGGPQSLLVLATQTGDDMLWTSAARFAVVTRNGRIVRTAGFRNNLAATHFRAADPLTLGAGIAVQGGIRFIDLPSGGGFSLIVEYELAAAGSETISILDVTLQTIRVVEKNFCAALDWKYQNSFWLNADDGFVWRSVQSLHPRGPTLELEVFRPPDKDG